MAITNGTEGYYVTSNINNNHIFIPASGYKIGGGTSSINRNCQYWSNTLCNDLHAFVYHAYKSGSHVKKCTGSNRSAGQSVRPVLPTDREILAPATPAKRIGVFSVEKDKQVSFSQGNLQYVQYRDEWRFAENQYDYIGAGNVKNGALADKIDLFGWSGEDNNAPFGVSTSTNNADYAGEFVDWGSNVIQGDTANTWRTLSKGELEYLIKGRKNASNLRAAAQVNGVNGMVLLPDNWECPEGIDFKAGYHTSKGSEYYAEYQQFTKEQWRELETTGAIFLPAAGMHDGNGIADIQAGGYYWSATDNGDTYAYTLISQSSGAYLTYDNRYDVRSVRLVHDTIVPPPAPCQTFEVNGVSFNMMCVEGGTFTWGEGSALQQVTVDNYMIGQTEVTQALWKVVMGTTPEDEYDSSTSGDAALQVGDSLPMAYMSWNDAQMFLERLSELTGLAFRLPTEIEWVYAAKGGKRSKGYKFAGSDILQEVAWCGTNSKGEIKQVGQLRANELGTYDMSGNVWEFCSDVLSDGKIVAHGGSSSKAWSETHLKPEYRYLLAKGYKANRLGIRLALDTAAYKVPAPASPGKRIGVFSVAKDKQVSFSQGNLQYTQSKNQWRFAENQYDYIGEENVKNGALADKIDLFGWSGESSNAPFGVSTSTNIADYQGTFVDWSTIVIQGDTANTWRTLSRDEWVYLIEDRKNAPLLYGVAKVNGVNGMVLLPDADYWICPMGITFQHGLTAMDGSDYYRQHNDYTLEQWMQMEAAGAVFFPAMGIRVGTEYKSNEYAASIWTSTPISNNTHAYLFNFHSNQINISNTAGDFYSGRSVRLVHDTIVPPPAPCQTFEVNGVTFNMMCVEGGTFMMGAAEDDPDARADEKPQHQVTVSDFMIAQTEVTQELWTAVMGNNPSHFSGNNLPVDAASWNDCQAFIAKLNELTSLHFRLPTEAEWEFAARGGNHSRGYKYAGSDNIDEVAWYDGNSSNTPHEVGTKLPNELGLFDMSGNVWEFCQDWYSNTYYTAEAQTNPTGPTSGTHRVNRGGSWFRSATHCRIPYRDSSRPTVNDYRLGLRLVLDKHEYVDLGLSVLWATTNVGAESAEEYGDYFAWGETEPKEVYSWTNYKWCDGTENIMTKYNATDGLKTLQPEDDAAHVNWGGEWRMPTKEERDELLDKCIWTWESVNGVEGFRVTGPNGNSIFLPAAGIYIETRLLTKGLNSYFFTSVLADVFPKAYSWYFADKETRHRARYERCYGCPIRPVLPTNREVLPELEPAKRIGVFSVAKDKQVSFSQGNLQYIQSKNQWRFADNQYYYTGHRHLQNGQIGDTVMYFGWSAKNTHAPWGISMSYDANDFKGEFLDWGTNIIQGDSANTWRSMSNDEWVYLFSERKNASQLIGRGEVNAINGIIILPDDWMAPKDILFAPIASTTINRYTLEQWNKMEDAGAVFIPASGYFNNKLTPNMRFVNERVYAASSSLYNSNLQIYCRFTDIDFEYSITDISASNLHYAFARRLVRDTVVPFTPEYVDLGLSVLWATTNVGAESAEEYGDYFAWGETEPKDEYSWTNYKWCDGTENKMTKYNATDGLKTLQPEDDAAHVNWGGEWRMPTGREMQELYDYCIWERINTGEHKGYRLISKINGNSIFLPAAGFKSGLSYNAKDSGNDIWSSSISGSASAKCINFVNTDSEHRYIYTSFPRNMGFSVRPVLPTDREVLPPPTPAKRIGVFSVAKDKHVTFSQGNLQYIQSANLWRFADNQYDYIGEENVKDGRLANRIDLFGWSGKGSNAPWGISTSSNNDDYQGEFVDWGVNEIQGDVANTWRSMSIDEWMYILHGRKNAENLFALATVNGISGIVLLPDDWILPEGISFVPSIANGLTWSSLYDGSYSDANTAYSHYLDNNYSLEQWYQMENAGAVFLPAAGYRKTENGNVLWSPKLGYLEGTSIGGSYFTYTKVNNSQYYFFRFSDQEIRKYSYYFHRGRSVRLVHDTVVPFEPEHVDLGLSIMWATCNVGATKPEEYGDYFAWGETTPKEEYNTTTYQYYDRSTGQYTKYGSDSLTMLEPEDDAAHVNWGGEWRMPTKEEMNELIDKCTWTWTQYNGIDGYEVTGTNSNSIFLPAAGYKGSGGPSYPAGEYGLYWLKNELNVAHNYFADLLFFQSETSIKLGHDGARRFGFTIRPVLPANRDSVPDDDKVTVTIHATPSDASISLFCSGYTKEDNKITVDKGKSVLYQVSNIENCYLSQGDSLLNMTKDTTLYISLKSFSDGAWETIDNSTMKHTPNCYISRNNCRFAQYQNWEFYVMPATKGEIYRIRTIAGQHAAPWIAVSNPPDLATLTYATQVACSPNKGMAAYIAEEFVVPEGTNYLIINYRKSNSHPLIIERKVTDIQPIDTNSYTLVHGNDYNPLFCDSTDRASIMPYTIFIPKGVTIAPKPGYRWGYYTDVDTLNMPSGKLQYKWTTDSYVGEGKPVGITIKKDSGVFDFSSDSRYATDYFYTSDPSIWIKSSSED